MRRNVAQKLIDWKGQHDRKPLIISGARQVGKTYILKEFGKSHFPQCHYFNFEKNQELNKIFEPNLDPQRIIQELSIAIRTRINRNEDLIIFDEIQESS